MSIDLNSAFSRAAKDGGTSGGLPFKASTSVKQSPSKKHKDTSSNRLPSLEQVFYETEKSEPVDNHLAVNTRPEMYRVQTSPSDTVSSKSSLKDGKRSQSVVEANTASINHRKGSLGKSSGGVLMNGDHTLNAGISVAPPPPPLSSGSGNQNPNAVYQHIHDMANKRIATLDYFRKAHEGRVFWFNTVHFSHQDLSRLPNFSPAKLSRRATNYLLLGLSIPPVLDGYPQSNQAASAAANAMAAYDFLKTLNTLLGEFETYQQIHPPDGSTQSALSRARIPHMFKRATQATTGRTRRTSSNTSPEIGLPLQQASTYPSNTTNHHYHPGQSSAGNSLDSTTAANLNSSTTSLTTTAPTLSAAASSHSTSSPPPSSSFTSIPTLNPSQAELPNSTIFPSETPYTYLLTPPLPFAPDFYTVFATLCDVLIDAYQRIIALVNSPAVCSHGGGGSSGGGGGASHSLGELFAKADARLRKVIVGGVVREFEVAAREACRRETGGVARVVLGGLMA